MIEFKIPELGENVAGGDVSSVLVKVGDTIAVEIDGIGTLSNPVINEPV